MPDAFTRMLDHIAAKRRRREEIEAKRTSPKVPQTSPAIYKERRISVADRNRLIAIAILDGTSPKKIAMEFSISVEAIVRVARKLGLKFHVDGTFSSGYKTSSRLCQRCSAENSGIDVLCPKCLLILKKAIKRTRSMTRKSRNSNAVSFNGHRANLTDESRELIVDHIIREYENRGDR